MSIAEQFNRQIPEYYDFMYKDGYKPYEVYYALKKKMSQQYQEEEPLRIQFSYEVKSR